MRENYEEPDIHMYFQDSCPHCTSAKRALSKDMSKIQLHDLKVKKNYDEFSKLGGRGVPFFVSAKTKKTFSGNPGSFQNLLKHLSVSSDSNLKDLKVKIFVSDSCGYCKRLKQMLSSGNHLKDVKIISLSDADYESEAKRYKFSGYPFIVSEKTGKHILGAPPSVGDLVSALQ